MQPADAMTTQALGWATTGEMAVAALVMFATKAG